jgi:hypothetical protein
VARQSISRRAIEKVAASVATREQGQHFLAQAAIVAGVLLQEHQPFGNRQRQRAVEQPVDLRPAFDGILILHGLLRMVLSARLLLYSNRETDELRAERL